MTLFFGNSLGLCRNAVPKKAESAIKRPPIISVSAAYSNCTTADLSGKIRQPQIKLPRKPVEISAESFGRQLPPLGLTPSLSTPHGPRYCGTNAQALYLSPTWLVGIFWGLQIPEQPKKSVRADFWQQIPYFPAAIYAARVSHTA